MNVAEGLVACRKHGHVGGGVPALHVGSWPQPDDALGDSEARGVSFMRGPMAAADHHEPAVAVTERGERLDRGDQRLALEAAPDEKRGPRRSEIGRAHVGTTVTL